MRTTLIYNQQAGNNFHAGPDEILAALHQVGFEATYHPTSTEEDLDRVLAQAQDLVVVAGGDGSLRAVATRLLGKDVRITPLPMGTANNLARTYGLTGKPLDVIAGLADPLERAHDVGRVQTPQGVFYFLEAMGIGVFADILKNYKPEEGKSVVRSFQAVMDTLKEYHPKFFHFAVDGEDLSGSYLLFEVMNTPTMGFRYMLAPGAKPDDGLFDLVSIHASQQESYLRFAAGVLTGNLQSDPSVSLQKGRLLEIAWRGFPVHIDGEVLSGLNGQAGTEPGDEEGKTLEVAGPFLQVDLLPKAVHFLIPKVIIKR
jgi:diacylglycerol kinase family enzyme